MKKLLAIFALVCVGFSFPIQAADITLIVQFKGTGTAAPLPDHVSGGVLPAGTPCYRVAIVEPRSGFRLGTAYDCIANAGSILATGEGTGTTFYVYVFAVGSIVSNNRVVLRNAADSDGLNPVPPGQTPVNKAFTHIAGSFPSEDTIVGGTGLFKNLKGRVSSLGGVSFANFPSNIEFSEMHLLTLR